MPSHRLSNTRETASSSSGPRCGRWTGIIEKVCGESRRGYGARNRLWILALLRDSFREGDRGPTASATANRGEQTSNDDLQSTGHNRCVDPRALVLDVIKVLLHIEMKRQSVPVMDLPPTRDTGFDQVALMLPWLVELDQRSLLRPGADHRHLTAQDIQELGKLVEAGSAQEPTNPRDDQAGFLDLERIGRSLDSHRPKLEHREWAACFSNPILSEEGWAVRIEPDRDHDREEDGSANDQ